MEKGRKGKEKKREKRKREGKKRTSEHMIYHLHREGQTRMKKRGGKEGKKSRIFPQDAGQRREKETGKGTKKKREEKRGGAASC